VWGVNIKTPEVKENSSLVDIAVTMQNDGGKIKEAVVKVNIVDPAGKMIHGTETTQKIEPGNNSIINKQITVVNPKLWSPDSPALYTAKITVSIDKKIVDQYSQLFGIRSIEFSAEKGFLLNGKSVKLKGGCMHHDNGLLGSAAIDRAEERRVEIMKANGFNAIRCSHNPPSESFLNACDRIGMLVMDEFFDVWEKPKKAADYSKFFKESWKKDLINAVLRDRNHPGIVMWSIGNEIPERMDSTGLRIARQLIQAVKELDTTRPVTEAVNTEYKGRPWDNTTPMFSLLDIAGYNYEWKRMENDHQKYPDRIIVGTESFVLEPFDTWKTVEKYPYVIGDFVWTAMDYLGEAGVGKSKYQSTKNIQAGNKNNEEANFLMAGAASFSSPWPWFGANCGDIDINGGKKPQIAYRDVIWDNSLLEMNVHAPIPEGQTEIVSLWGWPDEWPSWNWKGNEGKPLQVRVFTKASHVKLELNGKVMGEKDLKIEDKYIAVFEVPYQSGELKAIASENGKVIASKLLKTAGEPAAIQLTADRSTIKADRSDLSFVKIEVVDKDGLLVATDSVRIQISVSGAGELAASGNASPLDMESVNGKVIKTFKGKAIAIVRPYTNSGKIILKVVADGLVSAELKIECR
jgi:beta-galactosidase